MTLCPHVRARFAERKTEKERFSEEDRKMAGGERKRRKFIQKKKNNKRGRQECEGKGKM